MLQAYQEIGEKKLRILISTDSLGMPRPHPDNISFEQTWPKMLRDAFSKKDAEFLYFPYRGGSIKTLFVNSTDFLELMKPNVAIFQFGIVDCTRRIFPAFTNDLPIVSIVLGKLDICLKKHYYGITKRIKVYYTSEKKFEFYVSEILRKASQNNVDCYFIAIAPPGEYLRRKVFAVEQDVRRYNAVLQRLCEKYGAKFVNAYEDENLDEILIKRDGHHLTPKGASVVSGILKKILLDRYQDELI